MHNLIKIIASKLPYFKFFLLKSLLNFVQQINANLGFNKSIIRHYDYSQSMVYGSKNIVGR